MSPFLTKMSQYRISRYYKLMFLLWDLFLLNLALCIPQLMQFHDLHRMRIVEVRTIAFLANVIWIFLLFYIDYNRSVRLEQVETILMRAAKKIFIHISLISVFMVVLKYENVSRIRLLIFYSFFFAMVFVSRIFFMNLLKQIRSQGYNFKNVVILGATPAGERIQKFLSGDLTYGYRILGFFDDRADELPNSPVPILGNFATIENYILRNKIDEMYIALRVSHLSIINKVTELCERNMIRVKFVPEFSGYTKCKKVEIQYYGNQPVMMHRHEPLESVSNRLLKKFFDFCFSLLVILLLFPWLFPIIIILIKLDSQGPIFFHQKRSGRDNKSFTCLKFRTMRVNSKSDTVQATENDSRVTKFGAFMRKTSIDELPQFFNVFWGTMTIVGPRPHMLKHTQQYSDLINHYLVRQYAKPGITGWAQINGFRGETKELADMEGRVEHDIWYIENWSLLLDIKIIYLTVYNVFHGEEKAY